MKLDVTQTKIIGKALLITDRNELICYRAGRLSIYDEKLYKKCSDIKLPMTWWKRMLVHFRLTERFLHISPNWAVQIPGNGTQILLQFDGSIIRIDYTTGEIEVQDVQIRGTPVMACRLKDVDGFADSLLAGDYGYNKNREPVSVYSYSNANKKWKTEYTFAAGMVRHIHGFAADKRNKCVYILTGDSDNESGIWKAVDGFREVTPIVRGSQRYRTCQMQISDDGKIYYITDDPTEKNYAYELTDDGVRPIDEVGGTCINGAPFPGGKIYATVCEPDDRVTTKFDLIKCFLTNKPGEHISNTIQVFYLDNSGNMKVLAEFEHDRMPLVLFQYATVTFSNYANGKIFFTPVSVKKYDNRVFQVSFSC